MKHIKASIRYIRQSDIAGFADVLRSVAAEKRFLFTVEPLPLAGLTEFVNSAIENNHAQYVAELDGDIIGWADIIPLQKDAVRHVGELGMGIAPGFRGHRIGGELLEKTIAHAWETGLTRIQLEVVADNRAAIALYERYGFEREGIRRNGWCVEGRYVDTHVMALLPRVNDRFED